MPRRDIDYKSDRERILAVHEDDQMMSKACHLINDLIDLHQKILQRPIRIDEGDVELLDAAFDVFITHLVHCELDQRYLLSHDTCGEGGGMQDA